MSTFYVGKYLLNACRHLENLTIDKNTQMGLKHGIKGITNLYYTPKVLPRVGPGRTAGLGVRY